MHYKYLCSDLDGTLLTTKSDVSEFTKSEIKRIKANTRVILVSARMPIAMTYIQEDLGIENEPLICYNGALVIEGNKEIYSAFINTDAGKELHILTEEHNIKLGLYFANEWYVEKETDRVLREIKHTKVNPVYQKTEKTIGNWKSRNIGAHKIMLMGTKITADGIYPKLIEHFGAQMNIYRSNDTLIEITPKAISKLSAIKLLLDAESSMDDVIAFGDNYNDSEMLEHAGCGVAVSNGRPEVLDIADYTTSPNIENGVAQFLKLNFKF